MPKGGGSKTPQLDHFPLSNDMVEKQGGKKDKVLTNKTPKLDRSDGVKEMKEKAPKRKLPFTAGANGDQKDSDSGRRNLSRVDFQVQIAEEGGVTLHHVLQGWWEVGVLSE
uniref:Ankyrin repeat domain containing 11 n=1 Tax=Fundulus heteroclitus TaxID=8078 RepID=A0A3Q2ULK4_FUNHE